MSADAGREQALPAPLAAPRAIGGRGAWRVLTCAAALLFALGWTLVQGKDLHWDALNYHLYLGFSALNDRFAQDFFAAGAPSYLNPYAYVPLYLMVKAGVPALWIAVAFATFHATILWLVFEIGVAGGLRGERSAAWPFALLGAVLAAACPIMLSEIGSTIADISTGVFVVGGWLALSHALRSGRLALLVVAGSLCGLAAGLKLSNAIYAAAVVPALAFLPGTWEQRARGALAYGAACAAAFAVVALPWAWTLWQHFGNPVMPLFNQWFASPEFPTAALRYERFLPGSVLDFLLRPFHMLSVRSMVHTEPRAPDLRYAALLAALAIWGAMALRDRRRSGTGTVAPGEGAASVDSESGRAAADRVLRGLLLGLGFAWCLWLQQSGNSRYFLPMACVAAAVLALVLQRLFLRWRDATVVVILLLLAGQAVQLVVGAELKRDGLAWDGPWMRVEVPDRLVKEPHLYLSVAFLSGSGLLPFLHPESGMINTTGFHVIGPGHPGGATTQAMIDRNIGRLRTLLPLPVGSVSLDTLPSSPTVLAVHVRRFGLRVDPTDCEFLRVEGNLRAGVRPGNVRSAWNHFLSCRLLPAPEEALNYADGVRAVALVFDNVEQACPNLFHPPRPVTEQMNYWVRRYAMGTEMQLWIEDGIVKYFNPTRGGDPIEIGAASDWAKGPQPIDCSKRFVPAFGGLGQ